MSERFKIGDWVRVKPNFWARKVVGKVFQITKGGPGFSMLHPTDISAWSSQEMPYWFAEPYLEHVSPKILIMQDEKNPKVVIARNLLTNEKAEAKCAPADEFDFAVGAQLALDRLLNKEHFFKKEEKPQYYNGKVVCVKFDTPLVRDLNGVRVRFFELFTVGKVYTVKDGLIVSNTGDPEGYNRRNKAKTLDDLNEIDPAHIRFIEYKGEA